MSKKKVTKLTKAQTAKVNKLEEDIEKLDLSEMSPTEIEKVVKAFSIEGRELRKSRKDVRYKLYRLRTESEGKNSSGVDKKFKSLFEDQPYFDNWRMFGTTWDVAFDDPYRIVHKTLSEQDEWNEVMKAKFPTIDHNGGISYPDINVRKKVEDLNKDNKK